MKTITRFFLLAVAMVASSNMGFAAQPKIDFETVGNTWTWTGFENAPSWSVVANPFATGINTSAKVGKIVANTTDARWAGVECAHGDFGPFSLTAGNSTIKIMVYKDVISPVGIKLVTATNWAQAEILVSNTKINEWEELTFDFSGRITQPDGSTPIFDRIVVFPDFPAANRTAASTTYIDNIVYDTSVTGPDSEKPTSFSASLGKVSALDVVLKLKATDNSGSVKYIITYGTTVLNTTGISGVEKLFTVSGLTASTAYNFSVTCEDATGNKADNNPIVVSATTSAPMAAAPVPTLNAANVMSVFSDTYTALPNTLQNWYANNFSTVSLGGNETLKNTSECCMGYEFTAKPIDFSSMSKLHVDIYPETISKITIGIVANGEFKKSNIALTSGQWNSIDIALTDFTGADLTKVNQVGFWDLLGTFYMDNLYLWKVGTGVNDVNASPTINCYPNPAVNKLSISAQTNMSEITVRNLIGQSIKTVEVNGTSKTIDLSGLASGNYFLVAKMSNGMVSTLKFSKL